MTKQAEDTRALEQKMRDQRDYRCWVTPENVDHIADRFRRLARSGRRMTLIEHIGESTSAYRVETGLTVNEDYRLPIEHRPGRSVHVSLGHEGRGFHGFGVHVEDRWPTIAAIQAERERLAEWRERLARKPRDAWSMLDPEMPHLEYVDIVGGAPGCDNTRDDRIVIMSINADRVTITKEVRFDTDPLRHAPRPPYRDGYDDDGTDAAWYLAQAAPQQTRWALLRDLCDRHPGAIGPAVWAELADLDMHVRPWMHTTEEAS